MKKKQTKGPVMSKGEAQGLAAYLSERQRLAAELDAQPPRVIIEINRGSVAQVYSAVPLDVAILDLDNMRDGHGNPKEFAKLEAEAKALPVVNNP